MPDDREAILSRVRGALAPLHERAARPDYDSEIAVMRTLIAGRDPVELFAERIKRVNGLALTEIAALVTHLRAGVTNRQVFGMIVDPLINEIPPALADAYPAGCQTHRAGRDRERPELLSLHIPH